MRFLATVSIVASLFAGSVSAHAQTQSVKTYFVKNDKRSSSTVALTPMVGNYADGSGAGIEIGGKASFEAFPKGFIDPINDSVSFEAGIFQGMSDIYTRTLLSASMRWDFNLVPAWTVFGAPGLASRSYKHKDGYKDNFFVIAASMGGIYNFKPNQALRFEADLVENSLRAGYMFRF